MTKYITLLFLALFVSCAHFNRELPGQEDPIPGGGAGIGTEALVTKTLLGASIDMQSGSATSIGSGSGATGACTWAAGVLTCPQFSSTAAIGVNGFGLTTNGAYFDFGAGANDRASSDGSIISFDTTIASPRLLLGVASANITFNAVAWSNNAPTISSGFGTSPSVTANNGVAHFTINVGTGGVATSGVIGLPATTNSWLCFCEDITTPGANRTRMTASTNNTCTVTNVAMATGVAAAWTASDILACSAVGR